MSNIQNKDNGYSGCLRMVGQAVPLQVGERLSRRGDNWKKPATQISRERTYHTEGVASVKDLRQQRDIPVQNSSQMLPFDLLLHKNRN